MIPDLINHFFKNMEQPVWNFEQAHSDEPLDETSVNLRAYFDRMPDEKLRQYDSSWPDEKVMEWDDNFRDDGFLMLLCCERDVDVKEYREVLEECLRYRERVRDT
jgi:alcohol dehydrogenase YqhD (iron-dependent ADH family)